MVAQVERVGRPREAWIDGAKGVAIALVALYHAVAIYRAQGYDTLSWDVAIELLRAVRMPLFFLASGLFAARSLTTPWRSFTRGKIIFFLWLFAVWSVLQVAARALLGDGDVPVGTLALQYLLLDTTLWYLVALPLFFLLARLLEPLPAPVQVAGAGVVSLLFGFDVVVTPVWSFDHMAQYFVFFLVGCHAGASIRALAGRVRRWWVVVAFGAWVVLGLCLWWSAGVLATTTLLPVVAVPAVGFLVVRVASRRWFGPMVVLGRHTLPVYVMHFPAISAVFALLPWPRSGWPMVVAPLAIALIAIVLSAAAGTLLRRVPGLFDLPWPARRPRSSASVRVSRIGESPAPSGAARPPRARRAP